MCLPRSAAGSNRLSFDYSALASAVFGVPAGALAVAFLLAFALSDDLAAVAPSFFFALPLRDL